MAGTHRRTVRSVRNFASIRVFRGLSRRVIFSARESHKLHETRRSYSCRFVVKNDLLAVSYAGLRFAVKFGLHAQREVLFCHRWTRIDTDGVQSSAAFSASAESVFHLCKSVAKEPDFGPLTSSGPPAFVRLRRCRQARGCSRRVFYISRTTSGILLKC